MSGNKQRFQESLRRAHNFAWDRQWQQAIAEYRRALNEFDTDPLVWISLGVALLETKQLKDAKEAYRRACDLQPNNLSALQKLAEIYERLGDVENASQCYLQLASALQKSEPPTNAVEAWRAILRLQPAHLDSRQALADLLEQLSRRSEAAQENVTLARVLSERGRTSEAAERARHALALDPRNADARAFVESVQPSAPNARPPAPPPPTVIADHDSPLHEAVQQSLARLAELVFERGQQNEVDRLIAQAIDFQSRERKPAALDAYERALARGATEPEIHFNLGVLYADVSRDDDAIREFTQTLSVPALALGSHFALGKCYRARGEIDAAVEHLLAVVKAVDAQSIKPMQADSLEQLYRGLLTTLTRNVNGEAVAFADSLIALMSSLRWKDKLRELRRRLDALSNDDELLSLAELLNTREPDAVLDALSNSRAYIERNKFMAAVDECYHGIALAPAYVPLHARLAEAYHAQGRSDAAVTKYRVVAALQRVRGVTLQVTETYRRILSLSPQDVDVRAQLVDLLIERGVLAEAVEQTITLGQAHDQLAQPERALSAYQSALRLIPRAGDDRWSITILHLMGEIYMQRVAWKEALTIYLQIRKMSPNDDKASLRLIDLNFKLNREPEMENELDHFVKRHEQSDDLEMLVPMLSDMTALRPRNAALRRRLIDLLLKLDRTEQAIGELDALGEMLLNAGQTREAVQSIEQIIALEPRNVNDYRALLAQLGEGA